MPDEEAYSLVRLLEVPKVSEMHLLHSVRQSMTGAGIEDGNLLVVEENEAPPDGSIVVALLRNSDEVTVKTIYRQGGTVRLVPQNGDYREFVLPAEEVSIQGEVVAGVCTDWSSSRVSCLD